MTVLTERFATLRHEKRCGFIPFVVAGDPGLKATAAIIHVLSRVDPVAIELGVPFSDPAADGPVIQRAAQRALQNGTDLAGILQMLRGISGDAIAPVVLFSYYNPILQFGIEEFARALSGCAVAGVLVVDLPPEAAAALQQHLRKEEIDLILLVAPTTSDRRLEQIARLASGFIYAVSRTGVTGTARELIDESRQLVGRIRAVTDLPVAVGFGITAREQARRICRYADAAVVGSRIVADVERVTAKKGFTQQALLRAISSCVHEFA
ncbi:MAG: tryptophan synthase subunit alpha [Chthoniobacterales bacterium]